jgi:hypothetical protein
VASKTFKLVDNLGVVLTSSSHSYTPAAVKPIVVVPEAYNIRRTKVDGASSSSTVGTISTHALEAIARGTLAPQPASEYPSQCDAVSLRARPVSAAITSAAAAKMNERLHIGEGKYDGIGALLATKRLGCSDRDLTDIYFEDDAAGATETHGPQKLGAGPGVSCV